MLFVVYLSLFVDRWCLLLFLFGAVVVRVVCVMCVVCYLLLYVVLQRCNS